MMRDAHMLRTTLHRIDGRGYKAFLDIKGGWDFSDFHFFVDHVQSDPFAAPSRVHVDVPGQVAGFAPELLTSPARRIGLSCHLARVFADVAAITLTPRGGGRGTGRSGEVRIEAPRQEVLVQTALVVSEDGSIQARFTVGLPANGRRVSGSATERLLLETVPHIIHTALLGGSHDPATLLQHATVNEDAEALRAQLDAMELVAFVADGACLPRRSGVDDAMLQGDSVIPFRAPESLRVTLDRPNAGPLTGMGVSRGITLIVGGGYHGKSTLLGAIEHGVYNHRPGDGREFVVTDVSAVKIRAEDGRSVAGVDISPFINGLPGGQDTRSFSTPNASGSTSQAAAIMEAIEAGAGALLVDEDTAATNFMIRDRRMQALVPKAAEPITPFVDRIRQIYDEWGVSSLLVLGGCGDYLETADTVVAMTEYRPEDVTERSREIARELPTGRLTEPGAAFPPIPPSSTSRVPCPDSVTLRKGRREHYMKVKDRHTLTLGPLDLDLSAVEPILSWAQANTLGRALITVRERYLDGERPLPQILNELDALLLAEGLDALDPRHPGDLVSIRRHEVAAALNRLRSLRVTPVPQQPAGSQRT